MAKEAINLTEEQKEILKSFDALERAGITKERAGTISNGITLLSTKLTQEIRILKANATNDPIGYIISLGDEVKSEKDILEPISKPIGKKEKPVKDVLDYEGINLKEI